MFQGNTVEPHYSVVPPWDHENYLVISCFSLYQGKTPQRNTKSWDQPNYLVIRGFCYTGWPRINGTVDTVDFQDFALINN